MNGTIIIPFPVRKITHHEWNDEEDRLICDWGRQGFTAKEIATKLSNMGINLTRNAIIGRWHRIHFKPPRAYGFGKGNRYPESTNNRKEVNQSSQKPIKPPPVRLLPLYLPSTQKSLKPNHASSLRMLDDAKAGDCLWIEGEAKQRVICGEPVHGKLSYCHDHALRVFATHPTLST